MQKIKIFCGVDGPMLTRDLYKIYEETENGFFVPAERIGAALFNKDVFLARFDQVINRFFEDDEQKPMPVTNYGSPISDTLKFVFDLEHIQYGKSAEPFSNICQRLETNILGGRVLVMDYGEIGFLPNGGKVPMVYSHCSTMVKSLAMVCLYLKHQAKVGDVLIVEEPEMHLPPNHQRELVRVLGQIANAGIQVVLSTHSDYVVREFNNLIMLSTDNFPERKGEIMKKYGYANDQLLSPAEVEVYIVTEQGATLEEVGSTGFEVEYMDKEITSINDATNEIYFNLHTVDETI